MRFVAAHGLLPVRKQSGFTLMEMLVAITLFSLIVVLLGSSFWFAGESRDTSLSKVDALEDKRLTYRIFKRYLETAQPVWQQQDGDKSLMFSATTDELIFVSAMPAHLGDAGLYQIRLRISGAQGRKQLRFDRRLLHAELYATDGNGVDADTILMDAGYELQFSYFGSIDEDEDPAWFTDWPSGIYFPDLVQLSIEDQSGEVSVMRIRMPVRLSALTPVMKDYPAIAEVWADE